jgi:hypothetical protein
MPIDDTAILERVDQVVGESLEQKDVYIALDFGRGLIQVSQLSGIALAKLFYLLRDKWELFELGDDFDSVAYSYVGRSKATVDRYVRVWEMYEKNIIPEKFEEEIRQKNIKDQIYIATLPAQGYEPDEDEWQDIVDAPDYNSVAKKVRDIKGKEPTKSALLIFMGEDGTLSAQQEDETQFVGYLNVDDAGDIAEKAIQRIIRSVGILQR